MPSLLSVPKKNHSTLLVTGYIRKHYKTYITKQIVSQCIAFADDVIHWIIKGDELINFLHCNEGEYLLGPTFTVKNIKFQLVMYPNGTKHGGSYRGGSYRAYNDIGRVQIYVGIKSCSSAILSIKCYVELFCCQTMSLYKSNIRLKKHKEQKNTNNTKNEGGWTATQLKLSQCKKYKSIDFGCYLDILQIMSSKTSLTYDKEIKVNKIDDYKCSINLNEKLIFSSDPIGKEFFSQTFGVDGNWCLIFTLMNESGNATLSLQLLRLSSKILIHVQVALYCNYAREHITFSSETIREGGKLVWTIKGENLIKPFFTLTHITLTAHIKILKVYVYDQYFQKNIEIPNYLWFKYGVINKKYRTKEEYSYAFIVPTIFLCIIVAIIWKMLQSFLF